MSLVEPALAERVLARALSRGGDFAELYAEARQGFGVSIDDRRVERPQGGRERGACVRVVHGDSSYYGHVDGLAEEDLLRVAARCRGLRGEASAPAALSAQSAPAGTPSRFDPRGGRGAQGRPAAGLRRTRTRRRSEGLRRESATPSRGVRSMSTTRSARRLRRPHPRALSAQVVARREGRVETALHARRPRRMELIEAAPERWPRRPPSALSPARSLRRARPAPTGGGGNGFGGVCSTKPWATAWRRCSPKRASVFDAGAWAMSWPAARDRLEDGLRPGAGAVTESTTRARPRGARRSSRTAGSSPTSTTCCERARTAWSRPATAGASPFATCPCRA